MATSQDFANWVCSKHLNNRFLVYLLLAEQESLFRFASGAIHQTIYYPELKALHICMPHVSEQRRIVAILDETKTRIAQLQFAYTRQLESVAELERSILEKAFAGKFTPPPRMAEAAE